MSGWQSGGDMQGGGGGGMGSGPGWQGPGGGTGGGGGGGGGWQSGGTGGGMGAGGPGAGAGAGWQSGGMGGGMGGAGGAGGGWQARPQPQQGSGWGGGWQGSGWQSGGRSGDRMGQLGMGLHQVNWGQQELVTLNKNTYQPSQTTETREPGDVQQWRQATGISVDAGSIDHVPNPILTFAEANFPPHVQQLFQRQGFVEPTPVQAQAWPVAMTGHNMVGIAKTGSGKTLAFGIPAVMHIQQQPPLRPGDGPMAMFLAPTRELCMQIDEEIRKVASGAGMRTAAVYGGMPRGPQIRDLRSGAQIVTATPGRMIDFLESSVTNLRRATFCVLDEADRMLDMGFEPQIRSIMSQVRPDRQTLMFSATWPKEVRSLAQDFLVDWVQLNVGYGDMAANADVRQHIWFVEQGDKQRELLNLLGQLQGSVNKVLIFAQTKHGVENLADFLQQQGIRTLTIHGDKTQQQRDHALSIFRRSAAAILIATDVAQRGLDIRGLPAVINYDFPDALEDYIHRIGRTGRAGDIGDAYSFFTPQNAGLARGLVKILEKADQPIDPFLQQVAQASGGGMGGRSRYGKGGYGGGYKGGKGKGKGKGRRW
eukprot:TRINITY_DN1767_c3_g1_i1.p1 TRINITY_DN1767_c3_g1~~TRINITY_DN1767_c3_g1_i1.p1  ORF type:complete len:593 (+),score=211.22 TRINITY_DN1767_c3_g1_i1:103-1881(+)